MSVNIPVSYGELLDKISILEIKSMKINDSKQKINVQKQLKLLVNLQQQYLPMTMPLMEILLQLKTINQQLWQIEDALRLCEQAATFDSEFVQLARQVYLLNDQRYRLKKEIDVLSSSDFFEEKFYKTIS